MRKSKFTDSQILGIIKEYDNGKSAEQIASDHKITIATFHGWRRKYGKSKKKKGEPKPDEAKRMKELEDENKRLKKMYVELSLEFGILKDSFS